MKLPITFQQLANIFFIGVILFLSLCSSPTVEVKTGLDEKQVEVLLLKQREEITQEFDLKIENNAFNNIEKIDSVMSDLSLRDSLRTIAFGR